MKYDMINCPNVPLPELLSFVVDNRGKTVPTSESGHVLIATNCIRNEYLYPVFEKVRFLTEETYQTWFRAHPKPGDIIFVNKGTPGRVCMVPDPVNFCIAQDMISFRVNPEKLYNKYLLAVLRSEEIQTQIYNFNVGDVIPHFKKSFLGELLIPLPDMEVQIAIGDMYFAMSEKMDLNTKINNHLEQMAQAIFADYAVRTGGEKIKLAELCAFQEGYVNPSQSRPDYFDGDIKWLRAVDINESFIFSTSRTLTTQGFESAGKSALLFKPDTIAISKSGTIGRLGFVADFMCGNRAVINIAPRDNRLLPFVYLYLKSRQAEYPDLAVGSVQKNLYVPILQDLDIIFPDIAQVLTLCDRVKPLFEQWKANVAENNNLATLRDTLLPRLMSGELSVADVDAK